MPAASEHSTRYGLCRMSSPEFLKSGRVDQSLVPSTRGVSEKAHLPVWPEIDPVARFWQRVVLDSMGRRVVGWNGMALLLVVTLHSPPGPVYLYQVRLIWAFSPFQIPRRFSRAYSPCHSCRASYSSAPQRNPVVSIIVICPVDLCISVCI
ncbi:hypothetical protein PDE_07784 [Penicillium oxalicum 114-2]|uniref:Uncharacterized protein n=1 Tax=Penicillium oxalicum (strain 114-2 / CGMCC 5302) TaxID=933388 RepID=S7ZR19_PENO1|nr:hypothetical protein PDE_07784 [Penicillium oxalicum 114-2]